MSFQSNNINLNHGIDPTFIKFDKVFVLSFQRIEKNNIEKVHRNSFSHYYVPKIEIRDFNVIIDGKSFFDLPVKNKK